MQCKSCFHNDVCQSYGEPEDDVVCLDFIDSTKVEDALEKQEKKKPIHAHKNYYCPICKEDGWILWDDADPNEFDNFCGKCGQAIDWSDD